MPTRKGKLLVVDDNEDALDLLSDALKLFGYEVHAARDPATAIEVAQAVKPDVALLDIGLPVMDGYELARRLRHQAGAEHLKFIAITGYGQPGDKQRAAAAGFHEHLVKPISLDEVSRVVENLIRPDWSPAP